MESLITDILIQLLSFLPRGDCIHLKQCSQTLYARLSTPRTLYFSLLPISLREHRDEYFWLVSALQLGLDVPTVKGFVTLHPQWLKCEGRLLSYVQRGDVLEYLMLQGVNPETPFPFPVDSVDGGCYPLYDEYPDYHTSEDVINYEAPCSTTVIHLLVYNLKYSLIHSLLWYHRTQRSIALNLLDLSDSTPIDAKLEEELGMLEIPLYLAGARSWARPARQDFSCQSYVTNNKGEIEEHEPYSPILKCYLSSSPYPEFTVEARVSNKWVRVTKFKHVYLADYYVVRGLFISLIARFYPEYTSKLYWHFAPAEYLRVTHTKNMDYEGDTSPLLQVLLTYNIASCSHEEGDGNGIVRLRMNEVDNEPRRSKALPIVIPLKVRGLDGPYIHCSKEDEVAYREGMDRAQILS